MLYSHTRVATVGVKGLIKAASSHVDVLYFRSLIFHPDGACLYGASSGILNIYRWEPLKLCQSVDLSDVCQSHDSTAPSDLVISQQQLVRFVYI